MSLPVPSFQQASFAAAILAGMVGCLIGTTPPNPSKTTTPATGDILERYKISNNYTSKALLAPPAFLALHTVGLALTYPCIPSWLLRHGATNGLLNPKLITWSKHTAIPLALILGIGLPLRLVAYSTLGKSFTFALAPPAEGLVTTGVYSYMQHPSYTGAMILFYLPVLLFYRTGGALGCWVPPRWKGVARGVEAVAVPALGALLLYLVGARVRDEERMLRAEFGEEWEEWHKRTARFVPWLF